MDFYTNDDHKHTSLHAADPGCTACPALQVREDPEWGLLASVPGLTDGWNDIRDKLGAATEEFKVGKGSVASAAGDTFFGAQDSAVVVS